MINQLDFGHLFIIFAITMSVLFFGSEGRAQDAAAPPELLLIVQEELKPRSITRYDRLETKIARECVRLQCPHPYLALESVARPKVVWWLNAFASPAEKDRVEQAWQRNEAARQALRTLSQQKKGLTRQPITFLTRYREDLSNAASWKMSGTRFFVLRVTKEESQSGHSVFEAPDGRLFVFAPAPSRQEADRQAKLAGPGAQVLAVQPRWSLPAETWIVADPEFWKSNPTAAQKAQRSGASVLPSDADIHKMLAERVDALAAGENGIGIVIGVVGPQGRRVISYGHLSQGDLRPLDGDTGFEIGSVTKVFTALLLADMVRKGEVALADPVAKYLPASVKVPERNGRSITLLDLATHTAGLPFMPDELPDVSDPAAVKYSDAELYKFLARYELPRGVGAEWEYSNVGYWLLAQALASRAGMDYESLLRTRVIAPLNLNGTAITISAKLKEKLAVGHNAILQPAPSWSSVPLYLAMAPAGGLVSTANDMLTLLSVALGYERSPLSSSMTAMLGTRRPAIRNEQALGCVVTGKGDEQLIVHDGGTFGYASAVAWDPKKRVGVVVLSNQVEGVSDIARHLLRPNVPLRRPTATKRTEITVGSTVLDAYAGLYEASGEGVFIVGRERDFLTIQLPAGWGLPKLRLRAESLRDFFVAELPLRVTFQTGSDGRINGLLVYPPRGQQAVPANRISLSR
jgi:serine-type D-Ala-D-Ala carboxypeptidase/endopeptidase